MNMIALLRTIVLLGIPLLALDGGKLISSCLVSKSRCNYFDVIVVSGRVTGDTYSRHSPLLIRYQ